MKKVRNLVPVMLLMFVLIGCSRSNNAQLSEATLASVYTSVAMTLSANATSITSNATPTLTTTVSPTTTELVIPTAMKTMPVAATAAGTTSCDNSIFVDDVTIEDGTLVYPGTSFVKSWKIKNTGTCDWSTSYSLIFYSGDKMSGNTTYLSSAVTHGSSTTISIDMVAPTTEGTYTGYWIMKNSSGKTFGQYVYVQINSSKTAYTKTPTPTITYTPTSTLYTNTPTSTTAAVTETPTPTTESPTITPTETTAPASGG